MKGIKYLLAGIVLGGAIGWALGYLRVPQLEKNDPFFLGFALALASVSLLLILANGWNRGLFSALLGKKTIAGRSLSRQAQALWWFVMLGGLMAGGVVAFRSIRQQNQSFQIQLNERDKKIRELAALTESLRKSDTGPLLNSVLTDIGEALKRRPSRSLSDTTLARINALCHNFLPYPLIEADSLSERAYSPGRGQLLLALAQMRMDTGTFARIKKEADFSGADLRGADLKGLDLSGINLHQANLKDADLSGAKLAGADLGEAKCWGAKLNGADLNRANLVKADLSWAQLNGAVLTAANLNGSNLTNAQLLKADLRNASVHYSYLQGALFEEADLGWVHFLGADLTRANLHRANLSESDLRLANFTEANLSDVKLDKALVEKTWNEKLLKWQVTGATDLTARYAVVNDSTDKVDKRPLFRLRGAE